MPPKYSSAIIRAKWFINQGSIIFIPQLSCYNVKDETNKIHAVNLFPKPRCTCLEKDSNGRETSQDSRQSSHDRRQTGKDTRQTTEERRPTSQDSRQTGRESRRVSQSNKENNPGRRKKTINEIAHQLSKSVLNDNLNNNTYKISLKKKNQLLLILNDSLIKDFNFTSLINETMIKVNPNSIPDQVLSIDYSKLKSFFEEDAFAALNCLLETKKISLKRSTRGQKL